MAIRIKQRKMKSIYWDVYHVLQIRKILELKKLMKKMIICYEIVYNTYIIEIWKIKLNKKMMSKNRENKYMIINKYQIDYTQLLGKGGMASVFLGYYA